MKAESLDEVKVVSRNILLIYVNSFGVTRYHNVLEYYSNDLLPFLFSTAAEDKHPSPLVAMLISGMKGLLVKYWILFCCSMFFVVSFSGKVSIN